MLYTLTTVTAGGTADVITDKLDTPLYEIPDRDADEAFPVFSSESAAQTFLNERPNGGGLQVAELYRVGLLQLLLRLDEAGVDSIVLDPPDPADTQSPLRLASVRRLTASAASTVADTIRNAREIERDQLKPLFTVSCSVCGGRQKVGPGDTLPYCCGAPMVMEAKDLAADSASA